MMVITIQQLKKYQDLSNKIYSKYLILDKYLATKTGNLNKNQLEKHIRFEAQLERNNLC